VRPRPDCGNDAGLRPVNHRRRAVTSSQAPGRPGIYAVDNCLHTWWQPADNDGQPTLEQDIGRTVTVSAIRICWRDVGLDYDAGRLPGAFRWRLEAADPAGPWRVICDAAANTTDLLIDYRSFAPATGQRFRLCILGGPAGITPGVSDFSLFAPVRTMAHRD
jgi:hypothetical protein